MSSSFANTEHLDQVLSYILVQKLLTRIKNTKAYKLGLVDDQGRVIRSPKTDEEKEALTLMDKFIFKLKRMIGPKINQLSNFLYVNSLEDDATKFLAIKGGVQNRASVIRVKKDIEKLSEKHNMSTEDLLKCLLAETIKDDK